MDELVGFPHSTPNWKIKWYCEMTKGEKHEQDRQT